MNHDAITVQDCLDNFYMKNKRTVLDNGQVVSIEEE